MVTISTVVAGLRANRELEQNRWEAEQKWHDDCSAHRLAWHFHSFWYTGACLSVLKPCQRDRLSDWRLSAAPDTCDSNITATLPRSTAQRVCAFVWICPCGWPFISGIFLPFTPVMSPWHTHLTHELNCFKLEVGEVSCAGVWGKHLHWVCAHVSRSIY